MIASLPLISILCMFVTYPSWPLGRADPECVLGHLLKILFKNDDFMNTVRMDRDFRLFLAKIIFSFPGQKIMEKKIPSVAGEQLCHDQQRVFPQCSSLSFAAKHHAWVGDSCCFSRKGISSLASLYPLSAVYVQVVAFTSNIILVIKIDNQTLCNSNSFLL